MGWLSVGARPARVGLLAVCLSGVLAVGCAPKVSDRTVRIVGFASLEETLEADNRLVILDARPLDRFEAGRIPGAIHMPLSKLDERTARDRFDVYRTVLVFGENPGSALAKALAKRLQTLRVKNVVYFEDGWA